MLLEMTRAVARVFGEKAVRESDGIPEENGKLGEFLDRMVSKAVKEYAAGEPMTRYEHAAARQGAVEGARSEIRKQLERR